ncbi:hypothetical protein [Brevundimonas fluminis]|jgi:hypothetical protein|uniref:hypothetical protein n=1 Tax=Brevundimonas fluminis TaxID=2487274 RepID=UPI000F6578EA|nr:hypothetical protein [Brevundimonas fluminis]
MRMLAFALAGASTLLIAGAASAQSTGGGGSTMSVRQQNGQMVGRMTQSQHYNRFTAEEQRRAGESAPSTEELAAEYGAERVDLALRVSELIEQGRCREARDVARAAGERAMVIRIRQTCRGAG